MALLMPWAGGSAHGEGALHRAEVPARARTSESSAAALAAARTSGGTGVGMVFLSLGLRGPAQRVLGRPRIPLRHLRRRASKAEARGMFHPSSSPVKPAVRIAVSEAVRGFHFSGRTETVTMKLDVDSTSRGMSIPRILPRAEHPISRGYIDPDALRVLYRLHRAGFKAYLVGGSVRDLMTGRTPKDFDVGTDARPQEIRRLFRNSRVIGRRFRLAHILFEGGKVVEVSTFRKTPDAVQGEQGQEGDDDLLIRSDNTFGSPEEDALRRDFTINGLFYDIATYAVLDFVGGVEDLEDVAVARHFAGVKEVIEHAELKGEIMQIGRDCLS